MNKRGGEFEEKCKLCDRREEESVEHLFINSPMAIKLWRFFLPLLNKNLVLPISVMDILAKNLVGGYLSPKASWIHKGLPKAILWVLWKARNERVFTQKQKGTRRSRVTCTDGREEMTSSWTK